MCIVKSRHTYILKHRSICFVYVTVSYSISCFHRWQPSGSPVKVQLHTQPWCMYMYYCDCFACCIQCNTCHCQGIPIRNSINLWTQILTIFSSQAFVRPWHNPQCARINYVWAVSHEGNGLNWFVNFWPWEEMWLHGTQSRTMGWKPKWFYV